MSKFSSVEEVIANLLYYPHGLIHTSYTPFDVVGPKHFVVLDFK